MKKNIGIILLIIFQLSSFATSNTKDSLATSKGYFTQAKQELEDMLDGKIPLSYERAIFIIENAYNGNRLSYTGFQEVLTQYTSIISDMKKASNKKFVPKKDRTLFEMAARSDEQVKEDFDRTLTNWAIYRYISDTSIIRLENKMVLFHFPYEYSFSDPMGTSDWANTQVSHLLYSRNGNCFALSSLYKIFADRLHSNAHLCTAPSHIYITHKNENGTDYNIELASRSFPGSGTLETLTYTTGEATKKGISLRELTDQQSVALCLVYLAKGYEHKFGVKDNFMLQCAETTLQYDSLNLNALLLKAEILEYIVLEKHKTVAQLQTDSDFKKYEKLLSKLYTLGYREMPIDMKNLLVKGWTKDTVEFYLNNYLVNNKDETRKASLSWGLFDEEHKYKPIEQYSQTLFDCKTKKIKEFVRETPIYNDYNFDPVVFAWNVDPLTHKFPSESPYSAFGDNPIYNIDVGGAYKFPADKAASYKKSYPILTKYLSKNVKNDVMGSTTIMGQLYTSSGGNLTSDEVSKATTWNSGPTILIRDDPGGMKGANGFYDKDKKTIELSSKLAKQLENASPEDIQAALYGLYVTLLHETTHYGDYIDGTQTEGEPGWDFANNVFYGDIVKVEGKDIIVVDPGVDHTKIKDAKKMMLMNMEDCKDVIPTVPVLSTTSTQSGNTQSTNKSATSTTIKKTPITTTDGQQ